jgi:hypothetical protein
MKDTIGAAIATMEQQIQAGTLWCPMTTDEVATMTPKASNCSSGSSHGISVTSVPDSNDNVVQRLEVSSEEKDYSDSSVSKIISDHNALLCRRLLLEGG